MIGKLITGLAGRSVARSVGGASAGPMGAVVGAALPVVLPTLARRLGPGGMIAAAVGGIVLKKMLDKKSAQKTAATSYGAPVRNAQIQPNADDIIIK